MKGKKKTVFVHIINALLIIAACVIVIAMVVMLLDKKSDTAVKKIGIGALVLIAMSLPLISTLVAEIVLIVNQVKHKYGKSVLITGIIEFAVLMASIGFLEYIAFNVQGAKTGNISIISGCIGALAIANFVLYILINKDNKASVAPTKAIAAPAPEKVAAKKKPVTAKKAPAKKTAPKKGTAKKKSKK